MRVKKTLAFALALVMLVCLLPTMALAAAPLDGYPGIEELPAFDQFPNPFQFFSAENDPNGDGYVSNVAEWESRREEIKELIQHYWLGYQWETAAENVVGAATVNPTTGAVSAASIKITNPDRNVTESLTITVTVPSKAQKLAAWGDENAKVPFVLGIGGSVVNASAMQAQGYGVISFSAANVYNDATGAAVNRTGLYVRLYPYDKNVYENASGALMAWAWACSQILNALEQPMAGSTTTFGDYIGFDPAKSVVTGHSRYGKSAMFAAAFDERIAIAAPSENGGSGVQSYRYKVEGKIFNWNTYAKANRVFGATEIPTVSYGSGNTWFPETAAMFVDKDNQIPFDSSDIIALIAPRPFFTVTGLDAHWLGTEGIVAPVVAASEVYNYIGKNDMEKNNIAIVARESNHAFYNRDNTYVIAIMDREFKQKKADGTYTDNKLHLKDLFPAGTGMSGMSYPARDYNNISDMNAYPYDINSSFIPWSSAGKYTMWTDQENFIINHDVTIVAHSNAPNAVLVLPDKTTQIAATSHKGEVFTFNLTAAQATYGRYELRTVGSAKENRSVYFSAVSLSDTLRHASSKGDEGEENRMIGFSSRIANTDGDPLRVYATTIDGELTRHYGMKRIVPEQITVKEYGITFHDNLFATVANNGWQRSDDYTFRIENLKFVTLPEYTFQFSMGDIHASAATSGKSGAANFTKPISWAVEKYNNGAAKDGIWPPYPDTVAERNALATLGEAAFIAQYRPAAPTPTATNFRAEVTGVNVVPVTGATKIVISFSEALKKGEFAVGLTVANRWETVWNDEGTEVTLVIDNNDLSAATTVGSLILFRLMDKAGNLLGGPIEKSFTLPAVPGELAFVAEASKTVLAESEAFDITAGFTRAIPSNAAIVTVKYDAAKFDYVANYDDVAGVTCLVADEETPGAVKLTLMMEDYDASGLINLGFKAKEGAAFKNATSDITVSVEYVFKNYQDVKSERKIADSVSITTVIDTAELEALIAQAAVKLQGSYTAETYAALKAAYDAGVAIMANLGAASQLSVDEAAAALDAALNGLIKKATVMKVDGGGLRSVKKGKTITLSTVYDGELPLSWVVLTPANISIAVSANGQSAVVTGLKAGTAMIAVKTTDGSNITTTITISVTN